MFKLVQNVRQTNDAAVYIASLSAGSYFEGLQKQATIN